MLPKVDRRWISHNTDWKVLSKQMLHLSCIFNTESLISRLKYHRTVLQPGYYELTEENVEGFVKGNLAAEHHPVGTYSILPREYGSVVDHKLMVYRITNLRLVDSSVISSQFAVNIQPTVYAIAENAADLIKQDWRMI